jgi:hypothetical protein
MDTFSKFFNRAIRIIQVKGDTVPAIITASISHIDTPIADAVVNQLLTSGTRTGLGDEEEVYNNSNDTT